MGVALRPACALIFSLAVLAAAAAAAAEDAADLMPESAAAAAAGARAFTWWGARGELRGENFPKP